jgi:signal transduction histidine kinase
MQPLLSINHFTRKFGTLVALDDVSFKIESGEVVGLAGRSGAGKTVLIKCLSGMLEPDVGSMLFGGQAMQWPFRAPEFGMRVVYQQPELADQFDVTSNIFLGQEKGWPFFGRWLRLPDQGRMDAEAARILARLDARLPSLHEKVINLTSEQRQLVAIAQVMARPTQMIIVDDPSQLLSQPYQEKLLELIREWQQWDTAVLFSSQNLDHLFAVCDRILVLRQGQLVANLSTDETTREEVVAALVGTDDRQQRTPVIWALDSYYQARRQAETLRHHQLLLQRDLVAQDSVNRDLLGQLAEQVQALDSANLALQDAQRRLLTEREQERKHLARELHDQMIQDLLSLNYQLEEIESKAVDDSPLLAEEIVDVREEIRSLVGELRRICGNLRPPTIDSLGLGAALQSFAHSWSERTGIEARLHLDSEFGRLPEELELSIYRIVQEALNNIRKHAGATRVDITLRHTSPRMLLVSIADNGKGLAGDFDLAVLAQNGHYGLLGISERVALMGGRLSFRNRRTTGLLLQVEIPHPRVLHPQD